MISECPSEILTEEGTNVAYFNDFENDNSKVSRITSNLCAASDLGFSQFSDFSELVKRGERQ